jgi:hypothetical protein
MSALVITKHQWVIGFIGRRFFRTDLFKNTTPHGIYTPCGVALCYQLQPQLQPQPASDSPALQQGPNIHSPEGCGKNCSVGNSILSKTSQGASAAAEVIEQSLHGTQ